MNTIIMRQLRNNTKQLEKLNRRMKNIQKTLSKSRKKELIITHKFDKKTSLKIDHLSFPILKN